MPDQKPEIVENPDSTLETPAAPVRDAESGTSLDRTIDRTKDYLLYPFGSHLVWNYPAEIAAMSY